MSKHESWLSNFAPIRQSFELNLNTLLHKNTLEVPGLTPGGRRVTIKRKLSSKTSASYMNKQMEKVIEKANAHLAQTEDIKQVVIPDLPPEEQEDHNVERMRMMKQREAVRREKDMHEKKELKRRNDEAVKLNKLNTDKLNKKNYTFDFNGGIIFIKKPNAETFPGDFNVSKISK